MASKHEILDIISRQIKNHLDTDGHVVLSAEEYQKNIVAIINTILVDLIPPTTLLQDPNDLMKLQSELFEDAYEQDSMTCLDETQAKAAELIKYVVMPVQILQKELSEVDMPIDLMFLSTNMDELNTILTEIVGQKNILDKKTHPKKEIYAGLYSLWLLHNPASMPFAIVDWYKQYISVKPTIYMRMQTALENTAKAFMAAYQVIMCNHDTHVELKKFKHSYRIDNNIIGFTEDGYFVDTQLSIIDSSKFDFDFLFDNSWLKLEFDISSYKNYMRLLYDYDSTQCVAAMKKAYSKNDDTLEMILLKREALLELYSEFINQPVNYAHLKLMLSFELSADDAFDQIALMYHHNDDPGILPLIV